MGDGKQFQGVFWVAVIPAFLALALIIFAVREPERPDSLRRVKSPLSLMELQRLGHAYWWVVTIATIFTLARFSEAFLVLRAQSIGVPVMLVPGVMIVMNVVYAVTAYPVGRLSDKVNRTTILMMGFGFLIVADFFLALSSGVAGVMAGVALWGPAYGIHAGASRHADGRYRAR